MKCSGDQSATSRVNWTTRIWSAPDRRSKSMRSCNEVSNSGARPGVATTLIGCGQKVTTTTGTGSVSICNSDARRTAVASNSWWPL